jgi:hypothetical protein
LEFAFAIVMEVNPLFLNGGLYSMNVRYRVPLNEEERIRLQGLLSGGCSPVREVKRAQILLATAE